MPIVLSNCSSRISREGEICFLCINAVARWDRAALQAPSAPSRDRRRSLPHRCCAGAAAGGRFCFICFIAPRPGARSSHSATPSMYDSPVRPPRAPSSGLREAQEQREVTANPKATLLIVDDEPDVREVLEEYFTAHGYATLGAENAAAAKAMAAAAPDRPRARRHQHAGRGWLEPCAPPAGALLEHRDRHADFRRNGRRPDRRPRDGRRRLCPQTLRPARARCAREERASSHVFGEPRRHRRGTSARRALRARPRRPPAHRRERARKWRCLRSSSTS